MKTTLKITVNPNEINEQWKPIIYHGENTHYMVSSFGRIMSTKVAGNGYIKIRDKILKPVKVGNYLTISLCINKNVVREYIHRLVAIAFIPIPQDLISKGYTYDTLEVNHILGGKKNKMNNSVSNLEWATGSSNKKHDYNTGIRPVGEQSHLATKNKEYQIHNVCLLLEQNVLSIPEISKETGVDTGMVYDILYNGSWTHISKMYKIKNYTPKNRKYSDDTVKKLTNLYKQGKSMREISNITGIKYGTIWYLLKK